MTAEVVTRVVLLGLEHKCSLAFRAPAAMKLNFKGEHAGWIAGVKVMKLLCFIIIISLIAED